AAEILEGHRLEGDPVRETLVREGLHDPVGPDLVEAAEEVELLLATVEAALAPFAHEVGEAVAAAGPGVPVVDAGGQLVGADPSGVEVGIGVRPEDLLRVRSEVAGDADGGDLRVRLDGRGREVLGHRSAPDVV